MISKQALESLEVTVPPIEKQRAIAELAALANEEQRLLRKNCRQPQPLHFYKVDATGCRRYAWTRIDMN